MYKKLVFISFCSGLLTLASPLILANQPAASATIPTNITPTQPAIEQIAITPAPLEPNQPVSQQPATLPVTITEPITIPSNALQSEPATLAVPATSSIQPAVQAALAAEPTSSLIAANPSVVTPSEPISQTTTQQAEPITSPETVPAKPAKKLRINKDRYKDYDSNLNRKKLEKNKAKKPTSTPPKVVTIAPKTNSAPATTVSTTHKLTVPTLIAQPRVKFTGLYAGIQPGAYFANAEVLNVTNVGYETFADSQGKPFKAKMSSVGPSFGAYFGYGWEFSTKLYFGFEAAYHVSPITTKAQDLQAVSEKVNYRLKYRNRMSGWMRAGYVYGHALFFAKLGAVRADFTAQTDYYEYQLIVPTRAIKKYKYGLNGGIGMDFIVVKNITIGVEIDYSRFNKIQYDLYTVQNDNFSTTTFKPEAVGVHARIGYKF